MSRTVKLVLDLVIGAGVPIVVLAFLSEPLGAVPAYLLSALIPVGWVAIDLLFLTRRFNIITSYTGFLALVRGLLAFWFVDGWQFALKDTASGMAACLVLAGSVISRRPLMSLFWHQAVQPDTPERDATFTALMAQAPVRQSLVVGTLLVLAVMVVSSGLNIILNLAIVTAPFGTTLFNQQVAQVNAITRVALNAIELLGYGGAFWLLFRALSAVLSKHLDEGVASDDDFWQAADAWSRKAEASVGDGQQMT
ncbi:MAG: hypothetical protein OHK0015_12530 [Chloroflexi bacterium OHK40]